MASSRRKPATSEDKLSAFLSRAPHRVAILVFPESSPFEVAAVAEIFSTANGQIRRMSGPAPDAYKVEVISSKAAHEPVVMEMGLKLLPDRSVRERSVGGIDTLFVSGGCWGPVEQALADDHLLAWLKKAAARVQRLASICTGAFLLAKAGLLTGPATTHWAHCARLSALFPHLDVRSDNIFVKNGNVYSSAGSTAVMDMALSMIEEDLGHALSMQVARRLVMFLKRPGGQSQFSAELLAQTARPGCLNNVPEWIAEHLDADLSVDALADRASMSPRNFARVFLAEVGVTPAKYVERARVEKARRVIEESRLPVAAVAAKAGFESDRQMRRAFLRWLKVTPSEYCQRFRGSASANAFIVRTKRGGEGSQSWAA